MLRVPKLRTSHRDAFTGLSSSHEGEKKWFLLAGGILFFILLRLAWWQIFLHDTLKAEAESQYERTISKQGSRGTIWTADGYALVLNEPRYKLFAQPYRISGNPAQLAMQLCPFLQPLGNDCMTISEKLSNKSSKWIYLAQDLSADQKASLSAITDPGIGFEPYEIRSYPQASMAAQLTGFVGKDEAGEPVGYFGLEGALENELRGRSDTKTVLTDALGYQLQPSTSLTQHLEGRTITLTIRRDIQELAERQLQLGMEKYGAKTGEIIIMDPNTGDILALANAPTYDQLKYNESPSDFYINRSLNDVYEPGSTFKVVTVAAGINEGVISPNTPCTKCSGPRTIAGYQLKTWNNEYHPNITMTEALEKSDNTAMIFVAELLGPDRMKKYLQLFGIGKPIGVELQGDRETPFPSKWGPVELATISFGQGVSTTSLQLVRAVSTIARGGVLISPKIIKTTVDASGTEQVTPTIEGEQVITPDTAATIREMMIASAQHGEAQWVYSKKFRAAGKTGTSQIAVNGSYDPDKTIASFIGFSPPEHPRFVMLVKLVEPQSSIWAAETAAPLWYRVAEQLHLLLEIPLASDQASN
jgi:stage V sporulation protein D (sporulation-specific penicillin-binding protein)